MSDQIFAPLYFAQRSLVCCCRFGTVYRAHLQGHLDFEDEPGTLFRNDCSTPGYAAQNQEGHLNSNGGESLKIDSAE